MAVNTALLLEVATHIRSHPDQFCMSTTVSSCRTTACIAGRAILLTKEREESSPEHLTISLMNWLYTASELLGIDYDSGKTIFLWHYWPEPYKERFLNAASSLQEQAEVAASFLEEIARGVNA